MARDGSRSTAPPARRSYSGYVQALADLLEHLRLGQLSPGGHLYESEKRWLAEHGARG